MTLTEEQRLDLLREALPYIQRFAEKTFVIKLSGKVTENPDILYALAEEVALFHQVGFRIVLVHGGGKQVNELADQLGVPQTVINGRRVTDADTLELAKMVFMGKINTDILSVLRGLGIPTVGLSGLAGNTIRARRREKQRMINEETGQEELVDFGHVGDVLEIEDKLLRVLRDHRYVPVISSLGADDEGNVFNINADTIAAEIAAHLQAEKLILLTDVDGIYRDFGDPSSKISHLTLEEAKALLDTGALSAGMLPKIKAIVSLLERGVNAAHILSGKRRNVLLQEIFTDAGSGTMITRD